MLRKIHSHASGREIHVAIGNGLKLSGRRAARLAKKCSTTLSPLSQNVESDHDIDVDSEDEGDSTNVL